jgi:hypothetical protein
MDGLPGMKRGVATRWREGVEPIKKMVGPAALQKKASRTTSGSSNVVVGLVTFLAGFVAAFILMEYLGGDLNEVLGNYTEEVRALFKGRA